MARHTVSGRRARVFVRQVLGSMGSNEYDDDEEERDCDEERDGNGAEERGDDDD